MSKPSSDMTHLMLQARISTAFRSHSSESNELGTRWHARLQCTRKRHAITAFISVRRRQFIGVNLCPPTND
jgi:hypothetical protein